MTAVSTRLLIGITGHRKFSDAKRLAAKIDAAIDEIVRLAAPKGRPGRDMTDEETPSLRLVVLSPLAEGADRLVAERLLARPGAALEVVLPMDQVEYEADFRTGRSRSEFRKLLARARTVHMLPPLSREAAYDAAGRFVVDHCDVLIAVWDGKPAGGPGGTANVVAYARSCARSLTIIEP